MRQADENRPLIFGWIFISQTDEHYISAHNWQAGDSIFAKWLQITFLLFSLHKFSIFFFFFLNFFAIFCLKLSQNYIIVLLQKNSSSSPKWTIWISWRATSREVNFAFLFKKNFCLFFQKWIWLLAIWTGSTRSRFPALSSMGTRSSGASRNSRISLPMYEALSHFSHTVLWGRRPRKNLQTFSRSHN